jgi:hypothetical protein
MKTIQIGYASMWNFLDSWVFRPFISIEGVQRLVNVAVWTVR